MSALNLSPELDLSPAGASAPGPAKLLAQLKHELALTLRNGEQLLLTLIIPIGVLLFTAGLKILPGKDLQDVGYMLPGVIGLAIMSTAFTGQAIATGFERRYGALKRLGSTPLSRPGLIAAKTLAVVVVEILQVLVICLVGLAMGWDPHGSAAAVLLPVIFGTAAFSGLGLLMAGTLRAEITLAAANLVYLVLLFVGGLVFPLTSLPDAVRDVLGYLPSAALAGALRTVLQLGGTPNAHDLNVLVGWAIIAALAAGRWFRWE